MAFDVDGRMANAASSDADATSMKTWGCFFVAVLGGSRRYNELEGEERCVGHVRWVLASRPALRALWNTLTCDTDARFARTRT